MRDEAAPAPRGAEQATPPGLSDTTHPRGGAPDANAIYNFHGEEESNANASPTSPTQTDRELRGAVRAFTAQYYRDLNASPAVGVERYYRVRTSRRMRVTRRPRHSTQCTAVPQLYRNALLKCFVCPERPERVCVSNAAARACTHPSRLYHGVPRHAGRRDAHAGRRNDAPPQRRYRFGR